MAEKKQKKITGTRKEIESISERIKASRFSIQDLVVPLAVVLILLLLGLFLFVPMVNTAISYRQEIRENRQKQEDLENLEAKLSQIDEVQLQIDLVDAKRVIPQSLTVSSFISYIDTLAREKDLYSSTLSAGDTQSSVTRVAAGDDESTNRFYFGVSSSLAYDGSLEDISSFLDDLYTASPYVISARGVSLRGTPGGSWNVRVSVMGYYVPEPTLEVDPHISFENYQEHQDVIDVFTIKAEQLRGSN